MLSSRMVDRLLACRPVTPILIGICVGISISLIVTNAGTDSGCIGIDKSSVFFGDIFDKSHNIESLFTEDSKIVQSFSGNWIL